MTAVALGEERLLRSLRDGDERAFDELVRRYHSALVRVATAYVGSRPAAEEVAQDTWLAILRGLDRFEGRSALRTWIFSILVNRAKTHAGRNGRTIPFSSLLPPEEAGSAASVEPERFVRPGAERWAGHWSVPPQSWDGVPEARLASKETREVVLRAIDALPPGQAAVITLRDVQGCSSREVCSLLGVSEVNQRVLLHRARSRVRAALERHLDEPA
jgi:RNA polymerase sigma-70 factor, ECF subfamily